MINNDKITTKKEAGTEMGKRDMDIGNCARPIVMALSLNRDKKADRKSGRCQIVSGLDV